MGCVTPKSGGGYMMKKQSDKRVASKAQIKRIEAIRREAGDRIYHDPRRAGKDGKPCEGSAFVEHMCSGSMELNEVIYPRNIFQKLSPDDWAPFFLECRVRRVTWIISTPRS